MEHTVMNVSQSPVTYFHLGASVFHITLFPKISSLCSSLNVWYQVHTHIKQQSKLYI